MRNAFLLLILTIFIFSLCSLMWKSLFEAKNKPIEDKEPSRVEKLVKGDNSQENTYQQPSQEHFEMPAPQEEHFMPERHPEPHFDRNIESQNEQIHNEQGQPTSSANPSMQNNNVMLNKDITPEQIQAINAELVRKYGNNPNAEVSEEDLQKIIEQLMPTQNR